MPDAMNERANPFAGVGIRLTHAQLKLFLGLARRLHERHGARIHFYLGSEVERRGFERDHGAGFWESVASESVLARAIRGPLPPLEEIVARAKGFEARIGETLQRLAISYRHLNAGYSPGSFGHPRAPLFTRAGYPAVLHAVSEQLAFWDREIREKQLTLVIDGAKAAAAMARANGIDYRWFVFARIANRRMWAHDEYGRNPLIAACYQALTQWPSASLEASYGAAKAKNLELLSNRSAVAQIRNVARGLLTAQYQRLRGRDAVATYAARDLLRLPFRVRGQARELGRLPTVTLEELEGRPFVYFPLQKEPEIALMQAEPETTSQPAVLMALARELPAGVLLAVKEHLIGIGRRSRDFYRQLAALPNLVFLSMDAPPIETIRRAAATATIGGTAAIEAGILGRPAILFGRRHPAAILPHVRSVRSDEDLRAALALALGGRFDAAQAREDGARFETALVAASFDMGAQGAAVTESGEVPAAAVSAVYQGLVRSFEPLPARDATGLGAMAAQ
jgi:hypothetical protein